MNKKGIEKLIINLEWVVWTGFTWKLQQGKETNWDKSKTEVNLSGLIKVLLYDLMNYCKMFTVLIIQL